MTKRIPVLLAGLPGKMATLLAQRFVSSACYELIPYALTGAEITKDVVKIPAGYSGIAQTKYFIATMIKPLERDKFIGEILRKWPNLIAIDFTQPSAKLENCRFYCKHNIPFVMGTTGGDNFELASIVTQSSISAVIAPNMSAPIVMLMDMFIYAASNYPGVLRDWEIRITESHQAGKADVSGTALAIGDLMKKLGVNFTKENIRSVRDEIEQRIIGIPEFAITGHGWHKYSLISPNNEYLSFEHNINGRDTYVEGTLLAANFLAGKIAESVQGGHFSMMDVLRGR